MDTATDTTSASCPACQPPPSASLPHSSHKEHIGRLNRIEGQVRGILKMVEEEKYCLDIINQLRAARSALAAVEAKILSKHIKHCLHAAFASEDEQIIDEKVEEIAALALRSSRKLD